MEDIPALACFFLRTYAHEIKREVVKIAEEMVIRAVVTHVKGNKSKAAKLLGIDRKKVERRMTKYGIV